MTGNVMPGYAGNVLIPVEARFWSKVERRGPDECWPWLAAHDSKGYGQIHVGGRKGEMVKAHRVALRLSGTAVPDGAFVLHSCDNPDCVNPAHLRVGTNADNMRDMYARGRQPAHSTRQTHCRRGHAFTPANTYEFAQKDGRVIRRCRLCRRDESRGRRAATRNPHDSLRADRGSSDLPPLTGSGTPATRPHKPVSAANPAALTPRGGGDLPLQPGFGS